MSDEDPAGRHPGERRPVSRHQLGHPDVTEFEIGHTTHRVAQVHPMDLDGVLTMTVGTVLWAVATIALIPFWGTLQGDGRQWWLWSALAGFGLGLIGIEYCRRRRRLMSAERQSLAGDGTPVGHDGEPSRGGRRRR